MQLQQLCVRVGWAPGQPLGRLNNEDVGAELLPGCIAQVREDPAWQPCTVHAQLLAVVTRIGIYHVPFILPLPRTPCSCPGSFGGLGLGGRVVSFQRQCMSTCCAGHDARKVGLAKLTLHIFTTKGGLRTHVLNSHDVTCGSTSRSIVAQLCHLAPIYYGTPCMPGCSPLTTSSHVCES